MWDGMWNVEWGMGNGECGMRNADCAQLRDTVCAELFESDSDA